MKRAFPNPAAGASAAGLAPFDVAVVIPTILRAGLLRAVRSIFAQDVAGRIQILIGVDRPQGRSNVLPVLQRECPRHVTLTVLDPGYSTAQRHGGLYSAAHGGALRTALSYLAHSRYVAYLDDDNWFAPNHLSSLLAAVAGKDWAFSYRWFVDPATDRPRCIDRWESVGPGAGVFSDRANGFVDTNSLLLDKLNCHDVLPAWCIGPFIGGTGQDRMVFDALQARHSWACTGLATSYYVYSETDAMHPHRLAWFRDAEAGVT